MLIVTRKPGEALYIGNDITVTICEVKGNQVRVGVHAPQHVNIERDDIVNREPRRRAGRK
ncbi:MAG: carbon storage regulator [Gammaproteobacteria bacterium]|nr:carbon storage regulator [Gammaproteobacteria bacterium]